MKQSWIFVGIGLVIIVATVAIFSSIYNDEKIIPEESEPIILDKKELEFQNKVASISVNNENAKKIVLKCLDEDEHCVVKEMEILSKNGDSDKVLATIGDITAIYQELEIDCHVQAHHLGEFLYGYTSNLTLALHSSNKSCGGAIYHGVMQNYFASEILLEDSNPEDLRTNIICADISDYPYSEVRTQCAHGVGHGLAVAYDYDIFTAVKRCDEFEDDMAQRFCNNGVFMQNTLEFLDNSGGGLFDENDLLFPCNVVEEKYSAYCYQYQPSYFLSRMYYSMSEGFAQCDKIVSEDDRKDCYYGMGMIISVIFFKNSDHAITQCKKGDPNFQTFCMVGAVYMIANNFRGDRALEFCKVLEENFKHDCYDTVGRWIHTIHPTNEEIQKSCSKAEDQKFYDVCINAEPKDLGLI